jgi:Mn-dependent DtxR family transcriptional regulator
MGHDAPTRTQLAAKAGWTPKGSNLRNRLSELSQLGLVEYPRTGHVQLTSAGTTAAPAPDTGQTLIESIEAVLTGPQRQIFDKLRSGDVWTRLDLANAIGWEPAGSNLRNRLSELSQLELVEYPAKGEVQLQEWVR